MQCLKLLSDTTVTVIWDQESYNLSRYEGRESSDNEADVQQQHNHKNGTLQTSIPSDSGDVRSQVSGSSLRVQVGHVQKLCCQLCLTYTMALRNSLTSWQS